MSEWIDGPPPNEEGMYVIQLPDGRFRHCTYKALIWFFGQDYPASSLGADIRRHFRLPDLPKPLPLPRRFRATYKGERVVGVEVKCLGMYWITDPPKLAQGFFRDELDSIEFIDPEETP